MDGFSISARTRAAANSDRRSDTGRLRGRRRSHLHLQQRHMPAVINPHREISGFRFQKATPETTDFVTLAGWRRKWQMRLQLMAEQLQQKKKERKKKIPSRVSHVSWEANSDELDKFASYLSISGGLHDG